MVHKLLKNMIIGLLIGLSTSYIIVSLTVFFSDDNVITGSALLEEIIISAVMGMVIGLTMLIFESAKLSFTVQLLLHYLAVTACVFVAGLVGEWFDLSSWQSIIRIFVIELVTYIIIWFMVWVLMKKEVDEINDLIKHRRQG